MVNCVGVQELRVVVEYDFVFGLLIMLGEGGVEWWVEDQVVVVLLLLNMNLVCYLVIQVIKNKKICGCSVLCLLDIVGLSQLLVQVLNLIVDCLEIQCLDIYFLFVFGNEFMVLDVILGFVFFSGDSESCFVICFYLY